MNSTNFKILVPKILHQFDHIIFIHRIQHRIINQRIINPFQHILALIPMVGIKLMIHINHHINHTCQIRLINIKRKRTWIGIHDVVDDSEVWKLVFQVTTLSHRFSVICRVLILRLINRNENLLTYL